MRGNRRGCPTHPRKRRSVNWVFNQLGRKLFRRAYRMTIESFYNVLGEKEVGIGE